MIRGLAPKAESDPESLKGLRRSLSQLFIARQILLCDLLAIPLKTPSSEMTRWPVISDEIASLTNVVHVSTTSIRHLIEEEDGRHWGDLPRAHSQESPNAGADSGTDPSAPRSPGKEKVQAQLRRLDAILQGIRGLNARMLLLRDEANSLMEGIEHSSDISSVLARQYDVIGGDLKSLISEWEGGRTTMLPCSSSVDRFSLSRSPSGLRSPQSPVHSLGGTTAVAEGSPSDALRRLTGAALQTSSNDGAGSDEEIFEAVALPPKPKRLSLTREEKLAKMQEDRRKRATLQESRDATTSMLRELETVIKHRPRGRTTSRITTV
jgi:Mysoin-binding motif of peroxisomes